MKEDILKIIYSEIEEINKELDQDHKLENSTNTVLLGKEGKLDSLGLINLIVGVEQKIEDKFGFAITLADERAMSQENSPFKTIQALTDYIMLLLKEDINEK